MPPATPSEEQVHSAERALAGGTSFSDTVALAIPVSRSSRRRVPSIRTKTDEPRMSGEDPPGAPPTAALQTGAPLVASNAARVPLFVGMRTFPPPTAGEE